jgi:acetyl-CoA carboxylase carboxyltransferase component
MGPHGAIEILDGKAISEIEDPAERQEFVLRKEEEYRMKFANPYEAAKYGYIDDVIEPRNTRFRIIRALRTLMTKKDPGPMKKHGNIPL